MPSVLFLVVLLASLAQAANDTGCEINIPGYVHHGNCQLLCKQASWVDVVVFFLGNYVAHAATVISQPGQSTVMTVFNILLSLFFPGAGIFRGISAIRSLAVRAPTALQTAAAAGALCMVVDMREQIEEAAAPDGGETPVEAGAQDAEAQKPAHEGMAPPAAPRPELRPYQEPSSLIATRVHGLCKLPAGFSLMILPRTARFENDPETDAAPKRRWPLSMLEPRDSERTAIACSYNLIKVSVAIAQLIFAIATLYITQGDQVNLFGYAAFGLTVIQYAWMTLINLLGNALCPQYATLFLVDSGTLRDLRGELAAQGKTDEFPIVGTVATISSDSERDLLEGVGPKKLRRSPFALTGMATYVGISVPIAIIGGLTRFATGTSGLYQRAWIMTWLVFGFVLGPGFSSFLEEVVEPRPLLRGWPTDPRKMGVLSLLSQDLILKSRSGSILATALYATPAIGGFVVVGQMILQYGACFEI